MWKTLDLVTGEEGVQDNFSPGSLTKEPLEEERCGRVSDTAWDIGRERTTDMVGGRD